MHTTRTCNRVLQKLTVAKLFKDALTFYGKAKVEYRFHKSSSIVVLSGASLMEFTYRVTLRNTLILLSICDYLLLSVFFLLVFTPKLSCISLPSHAWYMSCPSHSACLDYSNYIRRKSTNYETPHYASFSNLLQHHYR
jgi:hypothetical protein